MGELRIEIQSHYQIFNFSVWMQHWNKTIKIIPLFGQKVTFCRHKIRSWYDILILEKIMIFHRSVVWPHVLVSAENETKIKKTDLILIYECPIRMWYNTDAIPVYVLLSNCMKTWDLCTFWYWNDWLRKQTESSAESGGTCIIFKTILLKINKGLNRLDYQTRISSGEV